MNAIRLVVPFGVDGATDRVAQAVAAALTARGARTIHWEHRPGDSGILGVRAALRSRDELPTLLMASVSNASIAPRFRPDAGYDFAREFTPVALIGTAPNVLVVPASSPARDVAELVAASHARPGTLRYASAGAGQTIHVCGELFRVLVGADVTHVPYARGSATAYDDLAHGRVDLMFDSLIGAHDAIADGRLRALAVIDARRAPLLPAVPTFAEIGWPALRAPIWLGLFAAAAHPVGALVDEARAAVHAARDRLAALGLAPAQDTSPAAFTAIAAAADAAWHDNLRITGLLTT